MQPRHAVIALVIGFVIAAGAWGYAQSVLVQSVSPTILSGSDVGFRVEGRRGTAVVGRLMVRMDGQWSEAVEAVGPKQLTVK